MPRSVWPVLVAATGANTVGHWLAMTGILVGEGGAGVALEGALTGTGIAIMFGTVVMVAVATGRGPQVGAVAAGIGAVLAVVLGIVVRSDVPLPALAAGIGTGAALAVNRLPVHELWVRLMMVAVTFGYVLWVTSFSPPFAVIVAPLLPYFTVGISDFASERESRWRKGSGYAAPGHD